MRALLRTSASASASIHRHGKPGVASPAAATGKTSTSDDPKFDDQPIPAARFAHSSSKDTRRRKAGDDGHAWSEHSRSLLSRPRSFLRDVEDAVEDAYEQMDRRMNRLMKGVREEMGGQSSYRSGIRAGRNLSTDSSSSSSSSNGEESKDAAQSKDQDGDGVPHGAPAAEPWSGSGAGWGLAAPLRKLGHNLDHMVPREIAVDLAEQDGRYVVKADVPGVRKQDVKVRVKDRELILQAEHGDRPDAADSPEDEVHEEDGLVYYHTERSYGMVRRVLPLPKDADEGSIEARLHDGVLEVRMAKTESPQPDEGTEVSVN